MAALACPSCGSQDFSRWKMPTDITEVRFRRHHCNNCRQIFLTAQLAVSDDLARQMLTLMEQPTPSSGPTPSASALLMRTMLDLMRDEGTASTSEASA